MADDLPSFAESISRLMSEGWVVNINKEIIYLIDQSDDFDWKSTTDSVSDVLARLEKHFKKGDRVGLTINWQRESKVSVDLIVQLHSDTQFVFGAERMVIDHKVEFTDVSWYIRHLIIPVVTGLNKPRVTSISWIEDI